MEEGKVLVPRLRCGSILVFMLTLKEPSNLEDTSGTFTLKKPDYYWMFNK